ncbi:hypothetical protein NKR23_g6543 [Pleurostoma richardsiae]|uniref:Succinate dehydrogenase assembly factor 4, mitochondrial n=1 Tax=Pleurostoma richardsiae TaxID=41990 RepID=A0AA38RAM0_9PEZI|nr:hypothetical protein NKR23_g6543 [Pleurostoma richardsiae]
MPSIRLLPTTRLLLRRPLLPRPSSSAVHPAALRLSSTFAPQPSPPRLPPDEQAEFERLQRTVAERLAAEEEAAAAAAAATEATSSQASATSDAAAAAAAAASILDGDGVWRGAPPEFEGDKNPKTGEIGGPKNEPLRWGSKGDWSYNGRVTDF